MSSRNDIDGFEGQDARAIANMILDQFDADLLEISNLKMNKLLYFAHGFFRSRFGERLIRNHFEAWENGPVVRVVFDAFKQNGRSPIRNRAFVFDYLVGREVPAREAGLAKHHREYIFSVVDYYSKFNVGQLVGLTHRTDTPWHRARHSCDSGRLRDRIPDEWIDEFFVENFGGRRTN
jgi:uncharacterized phage-associated protein